MTLPKIIKTNGTCPVCNSCFSKTKMKAHPELCKQKQATSSDKQKPTQKVFQILVEGGFLHEYRIYFKVPANIKLKRIDTFLRKTWVECCGHLSAFTIKKKTYNSIPDEYGGDLSMDYRLDELMGRSRIFKYEYDFEK